MPRSRCTAIAVVVLLPFVPVMHAIRAGSASAMNRPSPPQTATPASSSRVTSGRYRLIPGLLITTSQSRSARTPSGSVARTATSSISAAPGASSTRTGVTPSAARRRTLARPSTPRPQTPTVESASADQEIGWRIALRNVVPPPRREQRRRIGVCRPRDACDLVAQPAQPPRTRPVRSLGGEEHGGPALVDVADTLERPGAVGESEQGVETRPVGRVLQRLGSSEDRFEVPPRH